MRAAGALRREAHQDTGLVFTREDGSLVHPDRFSQMFDAHVKSAGLRRIRLHDLRHTHVTLTLLDGESPLVVSRRVGRASVAFTLTRYAHGIPEQQEGGGPASSGLSGGARAGPEPVGHLTGINGPLSVWGRTHLQPSDLRLC
jgi:hypothetical protein